MFSQRMANETQQTAKSEKEEKRKRLATGGILGLAVCLQQTATLIFSYFSFVRGCFSCMSVHVCVPDAC